MDFLHDQLFDGRNIRVLTIVDTFTRLSPAIDVRQQFRRSDVVETLRGLSQRSAVRQRSSSTTNRNSSAGARSLGLHARVTLDFSRPGKPTDNAFIESDPLVRRRKLRVLNGSAVRRMH